MKWPRVTERDAVLSELPYLQEKLKEQSHYFEQHDLSQCIVKVVEYDGQIVGFAAARLVFQVEPVMLFPEFREAPHFAQQRATLLLIRGIDAWVMDTQRNLSGITTYFCFILSRRMQKLAAAFGMLRCYWNRGGKIYGKNMVDPRIGKAE